MGGEPAVGPGGPKASLLPLPSPLAPPRLSLLLNLRTGLCMACAGLSQGMLLCISMEKWLRPDSEVLLSPGSL